MLVVPDSLTAEIAKFAANSAENSSPVFVSVVPTKEAAHLSCWQNVQKVSASRGGQPVKGWRIWWIPEILIEAQAHVVWRAPDGNLLDVTPSEDDERACLFVSDQCMTEQPGRDFVPSRYENLSGKDFVDEYIKCAATVARYQDLTKTSGLYLPEPPELAVMRQKYQQIVEEWHRRQAI